MKDVAPAAAVGLLLGIAVLWWVVPDTNAGAVFLVVSTTIICIVILRAISFSKNFIKNLGKYKDIGEK
jgi:hypothetical protein